MRKLEAEVMHDQDRFPLDAMLDDVYGSDSDELAACRTFIEITRHSGHAI